MRIVFIGSVLFSKSTLEKLIEFQSEVVGVLTKEKSDFNADFCDLSEIAEKNNIPFKYVNNINDSENIEWIKQLNTDIVFCFGWSNLLKKEILHSTSMGVIGFHPSLLPLNKGRHPLIWAKVLGLEKSGCSFFFMDEGADTGDILSQKEFEILSGDDASSLYDKMTSTALLQIEEFLPTLISGTYKRIVQDKNAGNTWRKRNAKDGLIDFRFDTASVCNLVRGLTKPYVGAHCELKGEEVKVWKVKEGNNSDRNLEPGKVLSVEGGKIEVKTQNSSVILTDHEFRELPKVNEYIR